MADNPVAEPSCLHEWEGHIADGRVPYHFCRKCKATLWQGLVKPLRK